ncbi:hypothetical protein, partial [uncultured Parasutterella sp.]|uniref:hypothetical protein n=1 Tax=uncultured Parasutterella sp. TaxID=1263098 RepID=UPI0025955C9D
MSEVRILSLRPEFAKTAQNLRGFSFSEAQSSRCERDPAARKCLVNEKRQAVLQPEFPLLDYKNRGGDFYF